MLGKNYRKGLAQPWPRLVRSFDKIRRYQFWKKAFLLRIINNNPSSHIDPKIVWLSVPSTNQKICKKWTVVIRLNRMSNCVEKKRGGGIRKGLFSIRSDLLSIQGAHSPGAHLLLTPLPARGGPTDLVFFSLAPGPQVPWSTTSRSQNSSQEGFPCTEWEGRGRINLT